MKVNVQALSITRGLVASEILEYKEDGKRVFIDFTSYTFKAQFRSAKNSTATLFATVVPVAVGLGQIKISLTEVQTALFTGTTAFYDILALAPSGSPEKIFEGTVAIAETVSQWENTPPVTTAAPVAGVYNANQNVTLSINEAGSKIYYTTDGSTPTVLSTRYVSPISITSTTTVKFFAVDTAGNSEAVQTAIYTIDKVAPITSCSVANDATIATTDNITLTANEDAVTYYTTNGIAPTTNSTVYSAPFQLAAGNYSIRFFSVDTAGNTETVKTVSNITVA